MKELPKEVQKAKDAYYKAYDKIKPLVKANYRKYKGTIYEDCPPLIKEQGQFFVRRRDMEITSERLEKLYGKVPSNWVIWVTWYEKNK